MSKLPPTMSFVDLVDEYFIENRTKLLDIAAFLDRLDRATAGGTSDEYRIAAFREAVAALAGAGPNRVEAVQIIFSDPTTAPLEALDRKSASGAFDAGGRAAAVSPAPGAEGLDHREAPLAERRVDSAAQEAR
ncbi:MAG TPA: hypothetical protein VKT77_01205 [Chthonomonadaceae bacterium]|nr:hypothetical protein [Chthonomonadaceae bacterium]